MTFSGQANHAGTTPMHLRRDALAGAAEWIGLVERTAQDFPGLVATVGRIHAEPGASNVIAGLARASLDVRHKDDAVRKKAVEALLGHASVVAERRGLRLVHEQKLDQSAVAMDSSLTHILGQAVANGGFSPHMMISGAGHDAMVIAPHIPAAMLFLRSPGGVSHHENESVMEEDVAAALDVGLRFLADMEAKHG